LKGARESREAEESCSRLVGWNEKGTTFMEAQGGTLDWIWSMSPHSPGYRVVSMSTISASWADVVGMLFVT
jgi:hypothetical protein